MAEKEVPFCTLFLVFSCIACHICVLTGNIRTLQSFHNLGDSTRGWSGVGLGVSRSLRDELSIVIDNVSNAILESLVQVEAIQLSMDTVLSYAGNHTDELQAKNVQILERTPLSPGQRELLASPASAPRHSGGEPPYDELDKLITEEVQKLQHELDRFLSLVEPFLRTVQDWMTKFGDEVQAALQSFSTTLDIVLKIFDQIMSQLNAIAGGGGDNEAAMLKETFNLFDDTNTGFVTVQDLHQVARIYAIAALQGEKPEELAKIYDSDGDAQLSRAEMAEFVRDPTVPEIMAVVLGSVATRLSQIAGRLSGAKMRIDLAQSVVAYFQIVCSKNQTKVLWVSDALGNESMPLDFTAAIFGQLCLAKDADLTAVDVGQLVVATVYSLHPDTCVDAYNLMSDADWWVSNGFNRFDLPQCVQTVTRWLVAAQTGEASPAVPQDDAPASLLPEAIAVPSMDSVSGGGEIVAVEAAAQAAFDRATLNMDRHLYEMQVSRQEERGRLLSGPTTQLLLLNLLHGQPASGYRNPNADVAIKAGVPAANETLRFAAWLSANATSTSRRFQAMCFDYTSKSTNALDSFAQGIKSMVSTVIVVIDGMKDWATDARIKYLENFVGNFTEKALQDVRATISSMVQGYPSGRPEASGLPVAHPEPVGLVRPSASSSSSPPERSSSAPEVSANKGQGQDILHNVWGTLQTILTSYIDLTPAVLQALTLGKAEVLKLASNMDVVFTTFDAKGTEIFDQISGVWRALWVTYFCCIVPLTLSTIFYAFWAGGFFGGPQPAPEEKDVQPPQSFRERCSMCCRSCNVCCARCHDARLGFWSMVIIMQVVVLVLFLVCIALSILAAVKAFLSLGCNQVYLLSDPTSCMTSIRMVKTFLSTFYVEDVSEVLENVCPHNNLMTCKLISSKMWSSALLTTIGSLIAAVLSLQIIFEASRLHEKARNRRLAAAIASPESPLKAQEPPTA